MKTKYTTLLVILFSMGIGGCSSTKLTQQYKNPETDSYQANKILIIGITTSKELRRTYENDMAEALEKKNIMVVKSVDFLENSFTNNKKSLKELNDIENKLLEEGFDTILFTKITGKENRATLVDSYRSFAKHYQTFENYYYGNQNIYFKAEQNSYKVYTTETSLFCICPGKERELLWRGEIEVTEADHINRNVNNYITLLFKNLKENNLLFDN